MKIVFAILLCFMSIPAFSASSTCLQTDDIILAIPPNQGGSTYKLSAFDSQGVFKKDIFTSLNPVEAVAWNHTSRQLLFAVHNQGIRTLNPIDCEVRPFIEGEEIVPRNGSDIFINQISQTSSGEILIIPSGGKYPWPYSWYLLVFDGNGNFEGQSGSLDGTWNVIGLTKSFFSDPVNNSPQYLLCGPDFLAIKTGHPLPYQGITYAKKEIFGSLKTLCRQMANGSILVNIVPRPDSPDNLDQLALYSGNLNQKFWSVSVSQLVANGLSAWGDMGETSKGDILISSGKETVRPFSIQRWNSAGRFIGGFTDPKMNGAYHMMVIP